VKNSGTYAQKYDLSMSVKGSGASKLNLTKSGLTKKELERLIAEYEQEVTRTKQKYNQYALYRSLPNNIKERFIYWEFYSKGIVESPKIFLFGHKDRPQRELYPSAHNYYLDLIYHFGIIAVLPFIYLISLVFIKSIKAIREDKMTSKLFALLVIVLFFVFIDNSLKVSFRQPYSGMVIFFLWGVLLSRLRSVNKQSRSSE